MAKKKKKNKVNYLTQTKLGERFNMSSVSMGKILAEMGLRDETTKLPTEKALEANYAEVVKYEGKIPMAIWKSPVVELIRGHIESMSEAGSVTELNPLQKLIQKHEDSDPTDYANKEALHFLAANYHKPQVKLYLSESKRYHGIRTINQWFKQAAASERCCLPLTLKSAESEAEWMAVDNWKNSGRHKDMDRSADSDGDAGIDINNDGNDDASKNPSQYESLIAYVDGSFDGHNWSSAAVILDERGGFIEEIVGKGHIHNQSRNVTGEVYGAISAIDCALKKDIPILIYHDYIGIAKWADDEWKANLPLTQDYKRYVKESRKRIGIRFKHVKGHSGNKWNDRADYLAKSVLGI